MRFFLFENVVVVANFGLSVCTIGDTVGRSSDGTARVTLAGCLPDPPPPPSPPPPPTPPPPPPSTGRLCSALAAGSEQALSPSWSFPGPSLSPTPVLSQRAGCTSPNCGTSLVPLVLSLGERVTPVSPIFTPICLSDRTTSDSSVP